MADSLKIQFDSKALSQALKEYKRVSGMDHADVLEKKGKQLSIDLYKRSREFVPSAGKIYNETMAVLDSGKGLKISPGAKKWAIDAAIIYAVGSTRYKKIFGKGKGSRTGFFGNRRATLTKSGKINRQATLMSREIAWRQAHRFVTASSWLFKRWVAKTHTAESRSSRRRLRINNNYKGSAVIVATERDGLMYVEIQNAQDGVLKQDAKHGIISRSLNFVAADMFVYINEKLKRRAGEFSKNKTLFT